MDGLEGQNKKFVLHVGVQWQPVEMVGQAREVNYFSSRIISFEFVKECHKPHLKMSVATSGS